MSKAEITVLEESHAALSKKTLSLASKALSLLFGRVVIRANRPPEGVTKEEYLAMIGDAIAEILEYKTDLYGEEQDG